MFSRLVTRRNFYTLVPVKPATRTHRWLLVLPFIWQVGLAPLVNDVALRPFSLPFPMAWQMAGIVLTTLVIAVVYAIDRRLESGAHAPRDEERA